MELSLVCLYLFTFLLVCACVCVHVCAHALAMTYVVVREQLSGAGPLSSLWDPGIELRSLDLLGSV